MSAKVNAPLALTAFWALLYLWGLALPDIDYQVEALRAVVAQNMMDSGEWIVPYHRGEPYVAKPPLMYWIIALFSWPQGSVSEWTLRLPSALMTLATALLILYWCRRRGWHRGGLNAAFLFLCLPLVLEKGTRGEIEMLLAACVTVSLLALFEGIEAYRAGSRGRRFILIAYAFLALGVMAKGPPAAIFYVGTWLAFQSWRGWRRWAPLDHLLGIVIVCAIVFAWVLPLANALSIDFLLHVAEVEAVDRITEAHRGNEGAFYFYPLSLASAGFPAAVLLPFIRLRRLGETRAAFYFLVCWVVAGVVLFSLSEAKESRYLLPLYPALAILGGIGLDHLRGRLIENRAGRGWRRAVQAVLIVLALLAPGLIVLHYQLVPERLLWGVLWTLAWLALAIGALVAFSRQRLAGVAICLLALYVVLKGAYLTAVIPERNERKSPRPVAEKIVAAVPAGETVYMLRMMSAAFDYYIPRPIRTLVNVRKLAERVDAEGSVFVFYSGEQLAPQELLALERRFYTRHETVFETYRRDYHLRELQAR